MTTTPQPTTPQSLSEPRGILRADPSADNPAASARLAAEYGLPTAHCECGEWTGEACDWIGQVQDTVLVEYMPEWLRGSHAAARNAGDWPHNGSVRVRVERSCADRLLADPAEDGWSRVVKGAA